MPRRPRQEEAGALHHVYARGNDKQVIFRDDVDRRKYLWVLSDVIAWTDWRCLTYCLMDNHVHLVLETPSPNLGAGMHRLHSRFASWVNEKHGRVGHLFQGRFGSARIRSRGQLWATVAYVVRNPVEAGLCSDPEQWPWSSHASALAARTRPWFQFDDLMSHLSGAGHEARQVYAAITSGT